MNPNETSRRQMLASVIAGLVGWFWSHSTTDAATPKRSTTKDIPRSQDLGGPVTQYVYDEHMRLITVIHPLHFYSPTVIYDTFKDVTVYKSPG